MKRVTVIVEGATEERFVTDILAPELHRFDVLLTPIILGIPGHRGGRVNYARVRKDVTKYLKSDQTAFCTTLLDYYGLRPGFPGSVASSTFSSAEKAAIIEAAMKADIVSELLYIRADLRFLPYLQVHEYEGLFFSDPIALGNALHQPALSSQFESIRRQFATPEDINDDPQTAPSKRILAHYPAYRKVIDGTLAARSVTANRMRLESPRFNRWLLTLESLP